MRAPLKAWARLSPQGQRRPGSLAYVSFAVDDSRNVPRLIRWALPISLW